MSRNVFSFVGACLQAMIRFVGASLLATRTSREQARSHRPACRQAPAWALLLLALLVPTLSRAQAVRWDPPGGQLGFNQVSELSLVFENCEPDENEKLPTVPGLSFLGPPSSSASTNVEFGPGTSNGLTKTYTLTFRVRPGTRNKITIPAFAIKTDKGPLTVKAATFTVGDATVGSSGLAVNDVAAAKLTAPRAAFWAGEVFPVGYNLNIVRRYYHSIATNVEWPAAPLVTEDWSKPELNETLQRGERFVSLQQSTRAYVKAPGNYTVKPATQMVNLMVGTSGFGLFSQPTVEQRAIESSPLGLTIKPLPPAPPVFSGAVGEFSFTSKVVPVTAAVGEPVTWTIELAGTGNWPDIAGLPEREVSNDFQVVQPKSRRTMKDNALFEGTLTEDVVLVPTKPGTYRLAPVRFTYFDPKSGSYKTVASEPVTVTITGTSAPVQAPAGSGAPVQFSIGTPASSTPNAPVLPTAVAPVPPENLPRDPIAESAQGFVPLKTPALVWACLLSSVLCPLLLWLTLAALRSRERDPQRLRREARARLAKALAELRVSGSQPSTLNPQLKVWQSETARLWQIPHAAPGTPLVHACVGRRTQDAASAWARLWSEADRALHSREAQLPADWMNRAEGALQAVRVPGWPPFSLFAGRNLFPFLERAEELKTEGLNQTIRVAAWLLVLFSFSALQPSAFGAEPAGEAYKRGDFPAAEQTWRTEIRSAPNDWTARHNLGLALAQQDRWAEATAHWTGGFLLNARAAATRWDLALGLQRSGLAPPELVEFSRGEGRHALARWAAPGEWQIALVGAALLIAAALVVLLLRGYGRIGGWARPAALTTILLAILLAAAATLSLRTYGSLAHPEAVFVWKASTLRSIPTEADTTQKMSPLSAGSIAVAEKTFLGWTKLAFAGGQSGWVRSEDLIRLYR
ncbi:MAG: BatD family protein [Opitutae bacterium]|nr:BatD family protein [Opitutae bacterium]